MKSRSIEQIIEEQVRKWQFSQAKSKTGVPFRPIVTISREPGSGGNVIGERLARRLSLDLFHQEMIHAMAKSAKVSTRLLETLLFGVDANDLTTFALMAIIMAAAALLASLVPAVRATRVDPIKVLKAD